MHVPLVLFGICDARDVGGVHETDVEVVFVAIVPEQESRTSPIASQGQSNGGHLLRPQGDPRTSQLLSAYDRLNGPYD